jgi:dipeptidyl-peptidase-4
MRKYLFIMVFAILTGTQTVAAEKLELRSFNSEFRAEKMNALEAVEGTDQYVQITPDGRQIVQYSFKGGKQTAVLFDLDNTMGETIKSVEGYVMSPTGTHMLIQTNTEYIYRRSFKADFYIYTIKSRKLERLSAGGKQQVPMFSPDGNQIAFVRDNNLWLVKMLYDNAESQVTKDGKFNEIINGIPDWVNEEEFSFNTSYCFNADGTKICWLKYDESAVKTYSLQLFKGFSPEKVEFSDYPGVYSYKYPKAGQDNSKVSAWSYDIKSRRTQQLQVPIDADGYMPRIKMTDDPDRIIIYTLNRHQDNLCLYAVNPSTTLSQLLIREQADKYVPESTLLSIIIGKQSIVMPSDRSGFNHLYIYNMNGQEIRKVGAENEVITDVYAYDEATGDVFYQSALSAPYDRQVFVSHKNGKTEQLTQQSGWNSALFSSDCKYFINTWSNMNTPYVVTIRNNKGKVLSTPIDNSEVQKNLASKGMNRREMFSFTTSEGVKLNGWMLKPADFSAKKKYPVIMHQYSGPGSQQVVDSWNCGSMGQGFDYYLAQEGYIIVCVDGRGTGGRGAEFEKSVYRRLGDLESKDQVETALWLGQQSYVDKDNIGIWGWSYGGFNTLMSMSEGRAVFKCGVAIAPPTNWKFYDTIYTERYMRTPKENPEGYDINPIQRAENLSGALLICHGLADDNVHIQNTFEYTEALVQADKDFHENIYTNRNHGIFGGNTRNHLMRQVVKWFNDNLK